jgi:hypothetical protein
MLKAKYGIFKDCIHVGNTAIPSHRKLKPIEIKEFTSKKEANKYAKPKGCFALHVSEIL